MYKQAWSRQASVAVAALALAVAMPLMMQAQAYPFDHRIGAGYQVATGAHEDSTTDEADPTDDGSIIIECLGFAGPMLPHANEGGAASLLQAVSMPQRSLGPAKCGSGEHKQDSMGSGGGSLITVF